MPENKKQNNQNDNEQKNSEQKKKKQSNQPGGYQYFTGNLWKFLLIFLVIWFAFSYFSRMWEADRVDLSYTEFKEQVKDDKVLEVVMRGSEIEGKFKGVYQDVLPQTQDTVSYEYFSTYKPEVEDSDLIPLLEKNNVTIKAEPSRDRSWLLWMLIFALPPLLLIGFLMYRAKKMQGQMMSGGFFGVGKSKAKKYSRENVSTTFNEVAGHKNAKTDLMEIVDYLKNPQKFAKIGADIPKGILMMGPPGTGKTLLGRAVAGEAGVPFYSISGSEFIEMFVGVGASRVRDLFQNAKKDAPAIIFIDEIDSIGRARGAGLGGGHDEREQTLNQILSELDGFEKNESVVVMAATNRPDVLDPALTRPGRFDRQVTLELPYKEARKKIVEIHSRNMPLADDVDFEVVAKRTVGFSGADIENLVNEAALFAGRKNKTKIELEDFNEARDKILLGAEREETMDDEEKKLIAYHEAGHTLIAKLLPNTDPLQKVTIIPRGRALGATEQVPDKDMKNMRKDYLLSRIAVTLGGRGAEQIVFNEVSNGAANDLKQVTNIARKMVCQWGMSEKLGPVTFSQGEDHLFLGKEMAQQKDFSEYTAKVIDEEIQRIIKEMEDKVLKLLKDNKTKLEALAEALIDRETLENSEIEWLLDKVDGKKNEEKVEDSEKKKESENA